MSSQAGRVLLTKLAAAQRQLRSAIRLYFLEEDALAVHTIASAAFRLIADLKADRGMNEAADFHLTAIFYIVRDYRRGTLPRHIVNNTEMLASIKSLADKLPIGPEMSYRDVVVTIGDHAARQFWRDRNEAANFLKHADRDAGGHLELDSIDNSLLLMLALSSYTDLVKGDLGNEGVVFWLFRHVEDDDVERVPDEFLTMAQHIASVPPGDRRRHCYALIRELNEDDARSNA